jgi:hypothetical protein
MTRQTWLVVLGASLCFGLLPGCAHVFPFFRKKPPESPKDADQAQYSQYLGPKVWDPLEAKGLRTAVGPNSPYSPSYGIPPQFYQVPRPDGTIETIVRPLPAPEAQIRGPLEHGEEPSEPPPAAQRSPQAAPPAAAPQPQEPLVIALARLLKDENEAEAALKLLDRYDPATRDWFVGLLPLLVSLTRTPVGQLRPEEAAHMQDQVQKLLLPLRARANLVIDKMCYCKPESDPERRVIYRYRPLPEEHPFLPCAGDRPSELVYIYVELRNLGTVRNGAFYETRLSSSVEIRDDKGRVYLQRPFDARPLRSPDLSSDFYNTYAFYFRDIPPGEYDLILNVRDEATQPPRVARRKLRFRVAAEALAGN